MRLLASADIHGFEDVCRWIVAQSRRLHVDAIVLAGDTLGVPDDFEVVEEAMQASARNMRQILRGAECPVFYIMGNDDLVDLDSNGESCLTIHGQRRTLSGFGFVGYQCGPPFMNGPFERPDNELSQELSALGELLDERTVLVTHYPATGILDSGFGLPAIRDLVRNRPFLIHIHGHCHSRFGKDGRHFNVASGGQKRAMVFDLEACTYGLLGEESSHNDLPW